MFEKFQQDGGSCLMTRTMHVWLESLCHLLSRSPVFPFVSFNTGSSEVLAWLYKEKRKLLSLRGVEKTVVELQLMMNQRLSGWGLGPSEDQGLGSPLSMLNKTQPGPGSP